MLLGNKIESYESVSDDYMELIHDIYSERIEDPSEVERLYSRFYKWITSTDFFTAPASTRFHGSFRQGLIYHHIDVYNEAMELLKLDKFKDIEKHSAALVALTHDYCKIGSYDTYLKNVKNEVTGQWEKVEAYKWDVPQYPFGHGVTSMYVAQQFFHLTREEALAIRWHMAEYNVCDSEMCDLQEARDRYPLVLMLQTADRMSITNY